MRVAIVGSGRVGLVTGVCLAEWGFEVHGVDCDRDKVERLRDRKCPVDENGLPEMLQRNLDTGRLTFSVWSEAKTALRGARIVFLCVDTPSGGDDGGADLSRLFDATESAAAAIGPSALLVVKSTVPIGTAREIARRVKRHRGNSRVEVAVNPEFLRAGDGVSDFLGPSRVVIGADSEGARGTLRRLYRPLALRGVPFVFCSPESAELVKHASNAFLATKVAFANEIADLCDRTGADVRDVVRGMGLDERIGSGHLHPGAGFGGPCLPKDAAALAHSAREAGSPTRVVEAALASNRLRPGQIADHLEDACGKSFERQTIAVLGLAFKPGSSQVGRSPSLAVIAEIRKRGGRVRAHDPLAVNGVVGNLSGVSCYDDPYEAAAGADLVVIGTAWTQYARLDAERLRQNMRRPVIADLHNLFDAKAMRAVGFEYLGMGQPVP